MHMCFLNCVWVLSFVLQLSLFFLIMPSLLSAGIFTLFVSCYSLGFVCCFLWRTPPYPPLSLWLLLLPRWSDSTNKAAVIISGPDAISNWANLNGIANMDAQLGVHRCLLQYKYHTAHPPILPSGHILYHNCPWATYWAGAFQQILVVLYKCFPAYSSLSSNSFWECCQLVSDGRTNFVQICIELSCSRSAESPNACSNS